MRADSIRARTFRGVAAVSVATTALMFIAVFIAYEDLERAMLHLVFAEEESFFLALLDREGNVVQTESIQAAYAPDGSAVRPPALFASLPVPFSGELQHGGKSYLVHVDRAAAGTLYLAKDITLFEEREWLFRGVLAGIVLAALAIGLLLARLTAGRIARPLSRLAAAVDALVPGKRGREEAPFPVDFHEVELRRIAGAFARYLDELDELMQRERRLLAMASHELRTPVAVISGALEIIDRDAAADDDSRAGRALQRIRVAAGEMGEQLSTILALSRARGTNGKSPTDMRFLTESVIQDMVSVGLPTGRIVWTPDGSPIAPEADPVLAKMLVRNLVHNALQHAGAGPVGIEIRPGGLSVRDSGAGLPAAYKALLDEGKRSASAPEGAIGLYLVTLIAERLGWKLSLTDLQDGGTRIDVHWGLEPARASDLPASS